MSVIYSCKYCSQFIGEVDENHPSYNNVKKELYNSSQLTKQIEILTNGNINAQITCEFCEDYIRNWAEFYEFTTFIQ